ncbi:MAG: hypothetical protein LAO07_09470 [Acidobacteriia bacterium]|nr:hypothetical protein [Terriglobia bacterium]
MRSRLIPRPLRQEEASLLAAVCEAAKAIGMTPEQATKVYGLLPPNIRKAPAFKDRLTGLWRYEFGRAYVVRNEEGHNFAIWGTDQAPRIALLLKGVDRLMHLLARPQLRVFLKRLDDERKHLHILAELDPILRPQLPFAAEYEAKGHARGKHKIDWAIRFKDGSCCLVEVKHRIRPLLSHAAELMLVHTRGADTSGIPAPAAEGLFLGLESKFRPMEVNRLQGTWIVSGIRINEEEFANAFERLDGSRVQFAVLTHFEGDARILAKTPAIYAWVKDKFRLEDMKPLSELDRA